MSLSYVKDPLIPHVRKESCTNLLFGRKRVALGAFRRNPNRTNDASGEMCPPADTQGGELRGKTDFGT